jgi:hypothetical protein
MTSWLLPLLATAAAALATYRFCMRPMRRGHHGSGTTVPACCPPSAAAPDIDEQIRQATAERDRLLDSQRVKAAS